MSTPDESTESGEQALYHGERKREFEPAFGDSAEVELITAHIRQHIGEPENVFHEFVSDLVHVDVHVVNPTAEKNYYTLVTSGMSSRPMTPAEEEAEFKYAELMLCLPPDWPLDDENHQWPAQVLKILARFPHEYETWLAENHGLPNGQPPENIPGTKMNAILITTPRTTPESFWKLKVNDAKTIYFWAVIPLFPAEIKLKLKEGTEQLLAKLAQHNVTEILYPNRDCTVKKRFGLF
jgi:hypothetical protein